MSTTTTLSLVPPCLASVCPWWSASEIVPEDTLIVPFLLVLIYANVARNATNNTFDLVRMLLLCVPGGRECQEDIDGKARHSERGVTWWEKR